MYLQLCIRGVCIYIYIHIHIVHRVRKGNLFKKEIELRDDFGGMRAMRPSVELRSSFTYVVAVWQRLWSGIKPPGSREPRGAAEVEVAACEWNLITFCNRAY